jgi:putative pyruvate formate lyase activating enzyme
MRNTGRARYVASFREFGAIFRERHRPAGAGSDLSDTLLANKRRPAHKMAVTIWPTQKVGSSLLITGLITGRLSRNRRRSGDSQERKPTTEMLRAAYLSLTAAELEARVQYALAALADCRACPRDCRVNRLEDRWAACKTGRYASVSSAFPHFGEEDCLRGWNGSGTIFFSHCNLRCVFCQNYDISQALKPGPWPHSGQATAVQGSAPGEIAGMMLDLQRRGCHNINFVTPEHVAPQIVEAVAIAVADGLTLPLVYNTSAYDSLESLSLMDGIVDIYMPDFKYWCRDRSRKYMQAEDYPDAARAAIKAMQEQVGPLLLDENGLARRGVLVRHLVMPGGLDDTREILRWIAGELGRDAYVNLMDQYYPAGKVNGERFPEINRRLTSAEFREAVAMARDLGLRRLDQRNPNPRLLARFAENC